MTRISDYKGLSLFNSMAYQNISLTVWMLVVFELSVRVFSHACIVVHPSIPNVQQTLRSH